VETTSDHRCGYMHYYWQGGSDWYPYGMLLTVTVGGEKMKLPNWIMLSWKPVLDILKKPLGQKRSSFTKMAEFNL